MYPRASTRQSRAFVPVLWRSCPCEAAATRTEGKGSGERGHSTICGPGSLSLPARADGGSLTRAGAASEQGQASTAAWKQGQGDGPAVSRI